MKRTGKIAHLPDNLIEELNVRLNDGETAATLLPWLNDHPEVREVLDEKFLGEPISKQNLSAWRQGGYAAWYAHQELMTMAVDFSSNVNEMTDVVDDTFVDDVAMMLSVRYAALLEDLPSGPDKKFEARLNVLHRMCRDVTQLQHSIHRAKALKKKQEQIELEEFRREMHAKKKRAIAKIKQPYAAPLFAMGYGGGKHGEKMANIVYEMENDLSFHRDEFEPRKPDEEDFSDDESPQDQPADEKSTPAKPAQNKGGQGESSQVKPSPGALTP